MDHLRVRKVERAYYHELAQLILLDVKEPSLVGVQVTHVKMTPDLKTARVYFDTSEGRSREREALKGFQKSKGFLKQELAERVRLKFVPNLEFFYDEVSEEARRVEALFRQLKQEKKIPE